MKNISSVVLHYRANSSSAAGQQLIINITSPNMHTNHMLFISLLVSLYVTL